MRKSDKIFKKKVARAANNVEAMFVNGDKFLKRATIKRTRAHTQSYGLYQPKRRWREIDRAELNADREAFKKEVLNVWL